MQQTPNLAVIGGSGLYGLSDLQSPQEHDLDTPFGKPSAPIIIGTLEGQQVAFLARHGVGHYISPTEVNVRANIYALKSLGVKRIVSISACGSLRKDFAPGHIVIPDQLFDFTKDRPRSFFRKGLVAHIGVADPFCPGLSQQIYRAVQAVGATVHQGGTLITIEGPRFSTRAESTTFQAWGMSIVNMTTAPEAFLAREAEICYAVINHVTDYDVWHVSEEPVNVEMVVEVLMRNAQIAQDALHYLVRELDSESTCSCSSALAGAIVTQNDDIDPEIRQQLGLLVDKYLEIAE
jgi:5'-methylthioadenosine phosphorylase